MADVAGTAWHGHRSPCPMIADLELSDWTAACKLLTRLTPRVLKRHLHVMLTQL
jgi:hypothetical protein